MSAVRNNVLKLNFNEYPCNLNVEAIPKLSWTAEQTCERLGMPVPEFTHNRLSRKIEHYLEQTPRLFESGSMHRNVYLGLVKSLISTLLLTALVVCIFLLLTNPTAPAIIPFLLGLVLPLYPVCSYCWGAFAVDEVEKQDAALIGFASREDKLRINNNHSLVLTLCHWLIPFTSIFEPFYHMHSWKKVFRIQQENFERDLTDQFKFYMTQFYDLDEAISRKRCTLEEAISAEALQKTQRELRAAHAFYMHALEPTRKKIATEIETTRIFPKVLNPIIAEYV